MGSRQRIARHFSGWSLMRRQDSSATSFPSMRALRRCSVVPWGISSGGSLHAESEYAVLAFAKLLGQDVQGAEFFSRCNEDGYDIYTRFLLHYPQAIASAVVAINAKSEGCLVVTGTRGYIYVPAPWWKTEYYEARFEDFNKNLKFFYKFQGEGLRYEIAEFTKCIHTGKESLLLTQEETRLMAQIMEAFDRGDQTLIF